MNVGPFLCTYKKMQMKIDLHEHHNLAQKYEGVNVSHSSYHLRE